LIYINIWRAWIPVKSLGPCSSLGRGVNSKSIEFFNAFLLLSISAIVVSGYKQHTQIVAMAVAHCSC